MRTIRWAALVTLLLAVGALTAAPADSKVAVAVVKYAELGKIICGLRGKVVLVDFWSTG